MKICVLISIYNEAKTIADIVEKLVAKGLKVFVIDDGSTDGSGLIAKDKGATVLRNEQKQGKGFSLNKGFEFIKQLDFDGVILMDGDGQHDVGDVDSFLTAIDISKKQIIVGNRMNNPKGMPFVRLLTNKFMSFIISVSIGVKIQDTQCGFRYLSSEIFDEISFDTTGFEIETELLMKAAKKKIEIASVPVKTIYSDEESKISPIRDTLRFFSYFFKEITSKN